MAEERVGTSQRRLAIAGMAGYILEWYDFSIYGFFAYAIGQNFLPSHSYHARECGRRAKRSDLPSALSSRRQCRRSRSPRGDGGHRSWRESLLESPVTSQPMHGPAG